MTCVALLVIDNNITFKLWGDGHEHVYLQTHGRCYTLATRKMVALFSLLQISIFFNTAVVYILYIAVYAYVY